MLVKSPAVCWQIPRRNGPDSDFSRIKTVLFDGAGCRMPRVKGKCSTVRVDRAYRSIGIRGSTTYITPFGMPDMACGFVLLTGLVL